MAQTYDVAVIGLGVMGAASTAMLAANGASVIGFDRYSPPHDRGSSHGETRLLRIAYAEGDAYVPMAQRSVALWRELEATSERTLFHRTGIIYAGSPQSGLLSGVRHSARKYNLILETSGDTPAPPGMAIAPDWDILVEPDAGFLHAEPAVEVLLEEARKSGARLVTERSICFEPDGTGFSVSAGSESFNAAKLVICAGGWLPELVPDLARTVWLERRVLHWFEAPPEFRREAGFRPFVVALDDRNWIYGFPSLDCVSIKLANHFGGERIASPAGLETPITPADTAPVEDAIRRIFPGLGARLRSKNCLYTMTPDEHFLIGEHPDRRNILIVGGMSGHGFKFAPAIGELAARWARDGALPPGAGMFSPFRFL